MKRIGNLFQHVISLENLRTADAIAQTGKRTQPGVIAHNKNGEQNIHELRDMMAYKEYTTSPYTVFQINDTKPRDIYRLPYYPDRIVYHAAMQVIGEILEATFTADTYACIKGRGIHKASYALRKALLDYPGTQYCLKIDVKKFYPSIDHGILKSLIRRKIKDPELLWLLDDIIDSAEGLPIGNYLSQSLSNFYLSTLDHWIKEVKKVRYYFRYADDMVFPAATKQELHQLRAEIQQFLKDKLKLELKKNYQVFPVDSRGIDFLGYVHFHGYTRVRKRNKKRFCRRIARGCGMATIASYHGLFKHANTNHLLKKILYDNKEFQRLQYKAQAEKFGRAQNRHRGNTGQTNNGAVLGAETIEIQGGRLPVYADPLRRETKSGIQTIEDTDRPDRADPGRRFTIQHNDN